MGGVPASHMHKQEEGGREETRLNANTDSTTAHRGQVQAIIGEEQKRDAAITELTKPVCTSGERTRTPSHARPHHTRENKGKEKVRRREWIVVMRGYTEGRTNKAKDARHL